MNALFAYVLEMSVAGSIAVAAVLFFRFLLRKSPKWIVCAIWSLVALRLLFPFSIESPISFVPPQKEEFRAQIRESFGNEGEFGSFWNSLDGDTPVFSEESAPSEAPEETKTQIEISFKDALPWIWLTGLVVMLVSMTVSFLRLKRNMSSSVPFARGVRQSECVQSPFILGWIKPVIYLPFGLDSGTVSSVLDHEKAHIKRGDHVVKPFAWLLLSVHWFNPLLWLSYALLCKDIEAACDEKVLATLNEEQRRDYARALLKCSTRSVGVYACPLAFGELNVKERIKMTLSYKKPVFWVIVLSLLIALVATIGILSDPIAKKEEAPEATPQGVSIKDYPREKSEQADWWGSMNEFSITASGVNSIYDFTYDQAVFREKAINKNDKNWTDPVMVAESMDELTEILDGCLKDGEQNQFMMEAVKYYFKEKTKEFNKLYPSSAAPDFFDNHVIMMVFARPQDTCWYVNKAMLKEKGDGALQVLLDIANYFPYDNAMNIDPYDGSQKSNESLQFYWISKEAWKEYKEKDIEFKATMYYQPEWIRYSNYLYTDKQTGETYHITVRKNPYDDVPLACSVNFGKTYLTKSRSRYLNYYINLGYENDTVLRAQAEHATFYYPTSNEDGVLTVKQCAYKQSENPDVLATHVFKIKGNELIYDEKASPDPISGLPDGAVFSLKEFKS